MSKLYTHINSEADFLDGYEEVPKETILPSEVDFSFEGQDQIDEYTIMSQLIDYNHVLTGRLEEVF